MGSGGDAIFASLQADGAKNKKSGMSCRQKSNSVHNSCGQQAMINLLHVKAFRLQ